MSDERPSYSVINFTHLGRMHQVLEELRIDADILCALNDGGRDREMEKLADEILDTIAGLQENIEKQFTLSGEIIR